MLVILKIMIASLFFLLVILTILIWHSHRWSVCSILYWYFITSATHTFLCGRIFPWLLTLEMKRSFLMILLWIICTRSTLMLLRWITTMCLTQVAVYIKMAWYVMMKWCSFLFLLWMIRTCTTQNVVDICLINNLWWPLSMMMFLNFFWYTLFQVFLSEYVTPTTLHLLISWGIWIWKT